MTVLVGTTVDNTNNDFDNGTVLIGSPYVAAASGTADTITVRTHSTNTFAGTLKANIYTANGANPGTKIGTDVTITLGSGAHLFTSTTGLGAALTAGTTYWIVFISTGTTGQQWTFSCSSAGNTRDTAAGQSTTTMAATWPGTIGSFTETIDAYAETAVSSGQSIALTSAGETDTAQTLAVGKVLLLGSAAEADTAVALVTSGPQFLDLAPAAETDSTVGLSVTHAHLLTLTPATETDTAVTITTTQQRLPVQLGPGVSEATARHPIRTADGHVYVFVVDDTPQRNGTGNARVCVYKSDQTGRHITSFTEQDTTHRPQASNGGLIGADARLDAAGIVHVAWTEPGSTTSTASVKYRQFDTATDTWIGAGVETVATGAFCSRTSNDGIQRGHCAHGLALDAGDVPTVAYCTTSAVAVKQRTGGTWGTATTIASESNMRHPQLVLGPSGDLHATWVSTSTGMRYVRRTAGTWGTVEACGTDGDGVNDDTTLDQGGSLVLDTTEQPIVLYVSSAATDYAKVRRRSAGGTWSADNPTRTGHGGVFCHTPQIYAAADDVYVFMGHGDDSPNPPHPAYCWKPDGGSWTPGGTAGSIDLLPGDQCYVGGVVTTLTGDDASWDGSASPRYDPTRDHDVGIADVVFFDEDDSRGNTTGTAYYATVLTGVAQVTLVTLTPATEADTAVGVVVVKPKHVTLTAATESDQAQAASYAKAISLTPASESDGAQPTSAHKSVSMTAAGEADSAVSLSFTKTIYVTITPASENDSALSTSINRPHHVTLTPASETDLARTLTRQHPMLLRIDLPTTVVLSPLSVTSSVRATVTTTSVHAVQTSASVEDYATAMTVDASGETTSPLRATRTTLPIRSTQAETMLDQYEDDTSIGAQQTKILLDA